ncbi:MAG: glyoxylase-like metal-dependent hydrolase (beta-lactamase superfamily II) [Planctomycetota bacterium]|jgi:glyoxylase-like metal-dependent hydrolase (beta-lactamase superfamily II)/rhodanese-related sulfurtransferase
MSHPILKIINTDGCQSYLIGCPDTGDCLLVDPKVGNEDLYRSLMEHYQLELTAVCDTHTHADHLSAAPRLCDEDVPLWMSHHTTVARPMESMVPGEELMVGTMIFEVIEVPGHTPDSVALHGEGLVLTGDSLFVGGLGRADFIGSDPAQLFESVRKRLMRLPGNTLVLPGHGYNDLLFSTIDSERELNEQLRHANGEAYAAQLKATPGAGNSAAVNANLEMNLASNPNLPQSAGNAAACCASPGGSTKVDIEEVAPPDALSIRDSLSSSEQWIDVRDPFEYECGHIAGTTNIPLSELGFHLDRLRTQDRLYLSCRSGVRSMTAAKTLKRLGVVSTPVSIGGGILGWQDQGFPIEGMPAV